MKKAVKAIAFVIIFCALFSGLSNVLARPSDFNYQLVTGFFEEEPEGMLDAVLIGASPTYTFWSAPMAWGKYGITVRPCAAQGMPFEAVPFFLKEATKKHHDALFIITLNALNKGFATERIHWSSDYFPGSINRIQMIDRLSTEGGHSEMERMPLFFPIIQYKSRWSSLSQVDFHHEFDGLKTGMTFENFLETSEDISSQFTYGRDRIDLSSSAAVALEDTLDYCDSEHLNTVFILFPQCQDETTVKQYNEMVYTITERGYPCLDMLSGFSETELDLKTDFYDIQHTNIHGALKFTDYLSQYLVEHFGFEDKRGNQAYASWDQAYEEYSEIILPYLTAEEMKWLL